MFLFLRRCIVERKQQGRVSEVGELSGDVEYRQNKRQNRVTAVAHTANRLQQYVK